MLSFRGATSENIDDGPSAWTEFLEEGDPGFGVITNTISR